MSDTTWSIIYLAAYIVILAWTRRHEFRRRATFAPAALDLAGGICLSIPALAWLDARVEARCGDLLLAVLFVLGVISTVWFTRHDVQKAGANDRLPPRLRRRFALVTLAAALAGAAPDVWWGALALTHASRT